MKLESLFRVLLSNNSLISCKLSALVVLSGSHDGTVEKMTTEEKHTVLQKVLVY